MSNLFKTTLAILAATFICATAALAADVCSDPVETAEGLVAGAAMDDAAVCVYKGIPYAAAPVGELRWKPPQKPLARSATLNAVEFSDQCLQPGQQAGIIITGKDREFESEDCLYLNIWRPAKSAPSEAGFPVMFWIHGGGFMNGSGAMKFYSGGRLVDRNDVVLVTINYRLGPLGFLSHRGIAEEGPDNGSGNYGMLDQVAALEWVQKNIGNFGGDPKRVTIFGESAGGFSVCTLLAIPQAKGLFQRAIMESGSCIGVKSEQAGFADGDKYAARLGCEGEDVVKCLRDTPGPELIDAVPKTGGETDIRDIEHRLKYVFVPHVDKHTLYETPIQAIQSGNYNQVPLIVGTNRDEVKMFSVLSPGFRMMTKPQVEEFLSAIVDDDAIPELLELYPYSSYRRPADAALDATGDMFLGCSSFDAVEAAARRQEHVYYYRFDFDDHRAPHMIGAMHAIEVPFVFDALDVEPVNYLFTKRQKKSAQELSGQMMDYWTNFAYTGDPNGPGLPEWPPYTPETKMRMYLDQPAKAARTDNVEKCEFWGEQDFSLE